MPPADRASARFFWFPAVLAFALAGMSLTPRVLSSAVLAASFRVAAGFLLVWLVVLAVRARGSDRAPRLVTSLRPQHYIQALCQVAVLAYWGWYWRPVYDMAALIGAQLIFAYAFGMLLAWSRSEEYRLGFGPFPIILSINLFLWFKDDWFYLQFLMIAVGFLGKEFVRWRRDGRRVHIFNPSAFALGLFSLALIATGTTELTWGAEIASTLTLAPRIYLYLFLVGLVVMYFFSITLVAGTAAAVLFGLSALYSAATGVPYFVDSEIPAAVFLGLHLLITDPSTSPRTPGGKAVFGGLYGIGVFVLYAILSNAGAPTFYDKLLCVPLLNLSVRGIDHMMGGFDHAVSSFGRRAGTTGRAVAVSTALTHPRFNLAAIGVWVLFFGAMTATGRTDGQHTGDSIPFWEAACREDRRNACDRLLQIEATYCGDNSAWACNEVGAHYADGFGVDVDAGLARGYFARACELRFQAACLNLLADADGRSMTRPPPRTLDLRLLLREGGLNLLDMPEGELYARACAHDWAFACASSGAGP